MRITKENLTRYDQHFKSWHRRRLGYGKALENWHQTEEAGAVAFYPVGGSPLEGKVKFSFTETPPASGDKSPTNPSTITGVSSVKVTRCGKNICPFPYESGIYAGQDITITPSSDGSITINGTATSNRYYNFTTNIPLHAGTKIAMSATVVSGTRSGSIALQLNNGDGVKWQYLGDPTTVYTIASDGIAYFRLYLRNGAIYTNYVIKPQYEIGENVTAYEKYVGTDSTISLEGTYYGGTLDFATGIMTVTHVKETITSVAGGGAFDSVVVFNAWPSTAIVSGETATICEELPYTSGNAESEHWRNLTSSSGTVGCYVYLSKSRLDVSGAVDPSSPTTAEWRAAANAYLATNPLHFVFTLAAPYTVQLSPLALSALAQTSRHEPRLNTVYTDADSVQITYQKSPIRAATEQEMAILGLGGNV